METANSCNYVLLDAARMGEAMGKAKEINAAYICLFDGTDSIQLEDVAPYIFSTAGQTAFISWLFNGGWGQSWGIYFSSDTDIDSLHFHWQQHLIVHDEAGKESYLRFYDPRVLRIFLPICTSEQLEEFFGPVKYFVVEGETKEEASEDAAKEE